jgi:hypothetical protein
MSLLSGVVVGADVDSTEQDTLGGGSLLKTNVYAGKIDAAWLTAADSGAVAINLLVTIAGKTLRQQVFFTNKNKEVVYEDKKTKEKKALPGYLFACSLTKLLTGKTVEKLPTEQRVISLYDYKQKKEVPTKIEALVDLHGADVLVAVEEQIVDKTTKVGTEYKPTGETRKQNEMVKFFDATTKKTSTELAGNADAVFHDKWVAEKADKIIDKESKESKALAASGKTVQSGMPAGAAAPSTDDLFADV